MVPHLWNILSALAVVGFFGVCPLVVASESPVEIVLITSIDYEGDLVRESDIRAIEEFQSRFPHLPIIHFLNAAYFTKRQRAHKIATARRIQRVIRKFDEVGLHIHGWDHFVKAAGVPFRSAPRYLEGTIPERFHGARGSDVPLNAYTAAEIERLIRFSQEQLKQFGFSAPTSFRAGGWQSGPRVWQALKRVGIKFDSSAVPSQLVAQLYPNTELQRRTQSLWSDVWLDSRKKLRQGIWQMPNNMGLADYVKPAQFRGQVLELLEIARESGQSEILVHFGFHLETAKKYMPRVLESYQWLFDLQRSGQVNIRPKAFVRRCRP